MRKLLAAFLVAALSLLSFTAPAQADEGSYPEELIGEIVVAGKAPNDPQYVLTGSTLTFDLDVEFEPDDELECSWFLARDEDFIELHSCLEPLVLDKTMVGGIVFVDGLLTNPQYEDVLVYGEMFQEVRLPADSIKLDIRVPQQLRVDELGSYEIKASVTGGKPALVNQEYSVVIESNDEWVGHYATGRFTHTPSEDEIGVEQFLDIEVYSDNYDLVTYRKSLGMVLGINLGVTTNPVLREAFDRIYMYVRPAFGDIDACWQYSCKFEWLFEGKRISVDDDLEELPIQDEWRGKEIQLRVIVSVKGSQNIILLSPSFIVPKLGIGYTGTPKISGKSQVGSTIKADGFSPRIPGVVVEYQWYTEAASSSGEVRIDGAKSANLKLSPEFGGQYISVRAIIHHDDYASTWVWFDYVYVDYADMNIKKRPKISGKPVVGEYAKHLPAEWLLQENVKPDVTYQWFVNEHPLNPRGPLLLTADMVGKRLTIKGYAIAAGHRYSTVESKSVTIGKSTASVKAKLSKKSIKADGSSRLTVTVKTPGVPKPTGKVTVKVGKKTYKATLKASHKGKVSLALKGLKAGKGQAVKVKFTPTGKTAKAVKSSKNTTVAKITVKKISKTVAR
ncbi:Ig-like domain-containing protein [Populibacterium corticicola]|uniref:Ig-like domain-containing protein n=1 Tax=Populibacterium corticicola TaxID=1812826 RepID=A0ABW5XGV2_9MICO